MRIHLQLTVVIGFALAGKNPEKNTCTDYNVNLVARVVFGEARGEEYDGQKAVAFTVLNRVKDTTGLYHEHTVNNTVYKQYTTKHGKYFEYNTMDKQKHTEAYERAKTENNTEYQNAYKAAIAALCNRERDPTGCATAFCAVSLANCSALRNTTYAYVSKRMTIGNHIFVCQTAHPKRTRTNSGSSSSNTLAPQDNDHGSRSRQ